MIVSTGTRPDIVFIFCDQWNARYLGHAGHPAIRTPHLDALAAAGIVFDAAYTPSPVCMPARVSLASGSYPHSHGFFCNYTGRRFPHERITLFRTLQSAGYTTAKIGKFHYHNLNWGEDYEDYRDYYDQMGLDWAEETSTPFQGPFLNTAYTRRLKERGLLDAYTADIAGRYVAGQYAPIPSPLPPESSADGYVAERTLCYLEQAPMDTPLFLCVSFPGPHSPLDAPGRYADMYPADTIELPENFDAERCRHTPNEMRRMISLYMGKISHLDERVRQLVEALKRRGTWENTVLVFAADHGDRMGEHGILSKCGFQDGSVRIPMLISGPALPTTARGVRNSSPVSLLDLYPTFIDFAGGTIPFTCQGQSLMPIVRGEREEVNEAAFSEISTGSSINYMVRDRLWKWYRQGQREFLFAMATDPWETENLIQSEDHVEVVQKLKSRLLEFLMGKQVNHAHGYKILFDRINVGVQCDDPDAKKRTILDRLNAVHRT